MVFLRKLICGLAAMLTYSPAYAAGARDEPRGDGPGKIDCALKDESACQDPCLPANQEVDRTRAGDPVHIACPLTGELVCHDPGPPGTAPEFREQVALPPCRRGEAR